MEVRSQACGMDDRTRRAQTGSRQMIATASQDIAARVAEILKIEAAAVQRAAQRLDPAAVSRAVDILLNCKGKVILTGVGKSGVIAQKIAQTLTSTGTAGVYVHPSDALHGGLGIFSGEDIVIALSNSGETDELL